MSQQTEAKETWVDLEKKLLPYQRASVDKICKHFENSGKALLADEVGLGKTFVAKGVVAKLAAEHWENNQQPFRVAYICPNQNVAAQNYPKFTGMYSSGVEVSKNAADTLKKALEAYNNKNPRIPTDCVYTRLCKWLITMGEKGCDIRGAMQEKERKLYLPEENEEKEQGGISPATESASGQGKPQMRGYARDAAEVLRKKILKQFPVLQPLWDTAEKGCGSDELPKVFYAFNKAAVYYLTSQTTEDYRLSMQHLYTAEAKRRSVKKAVQFEALTPSTSFSTGNGTGTYKERALLFATLARYCGLDAPDWLKNEYAAQNKAVDGFQPAFSAYLKRLDGIFCKDMISAEVKELLCSNEEPNDFIVKLRKEFIKNNAEKFLNYDMVIMDEASQCSTAMSLVPILRGASLMLVGDPQQLSPVILLDPADNRTLRRRYGVTQEYDYIENSIYKCFLACDAVSDETLLSYHYRCSPKIIEFNNRKYYNHKLHIASRETDPTPLVYVDVPNDTTDEKNTAPQEVRRIEAYLTAHPDKQVGIITPFAKQRAAIEAMLRAKHFENAACGTVHAFQGDEKDVVIFSLALTDQTRPRTYDWLKTNKELINVATSRAREQLVILSNQAALDRLHADSTDDDIYELVQYVRKNGQSEVTEKPAASRALGIKPYSTKTEDAFLENLNHALDNAFLDGSRCTVRKEVPIAQVFEDNPGCADLFYTGRFDFVVYQREGRRLMPILAIELDGREHRDDPAVQRRDRKKDQICREHGFELIRVENSYARRYNYIKSILINYFRKVS